MVMAVVVAAMIVIVRMLVIVLVGSYELQGGRRVSMSMDSARARMSVGMRRGGSMLMAMVMIVVVVVMMMRVSGLGGGLRILICYQLQGPLVH